MQERERNVDFWYGKIEDAEVFPDMAFWLSQTDEYRFDQAWEMVIAAHEIRGEDLRESRLQRNIASFQRRES
jgi:hypothetical protein